MYLEHLHSAFEELKQLVDLLPAKGGEENDDGWREDIAGRLARVGELLRRRHFRVALLNGSQCGKSNTANNLLGEKLLPEGKSATCSSVRVRIRRSNDGAAHLTYCYFTAPAFNAWRSALAAELKLADDGIAISDEELLKRIAAKRSDRATNQDLCDYLERLIRSRQKFGDRLSDGFISPTAPSGGWRANSIAEALKMVGQHPPKDKSTVAGEAALLQEIMIEFPAEFLHPSLELIDLPGLATTNRQDVLGTKAFLSEIDGAFLMERASNNIYKNTVFEEFMRAFEGVHRDFRSRIWLVLTYWEGLRRHLIHGGDEHEETTFGTISKTMEKLGLEPDRVVFVGNKHHEDVNAGKSRQFLADQLHVELLAGGALGFPEAVHREPAFERSYQALFEDGGIQYLRDRIKDELFPIIREKRTSDVKNELLSLADEIARRVKAIVRSVKINTGTRDERDEWLAAVHKTLGILKRRRQSQCELAALLEGQAHEHIDHLIKKVDGATDHLADETESVGLNYKRLSESLRDKSHELAFDAIHGYFADTKKALVEALRAAAKHIPACANSPLDELESKFAGPHPKAMAAFSEPIEHFTQWKIPEATARAPLSIQDYRLVMYRKVPQVVYEVHQRMHHFLGECLSDLKTSIQFQDGPSGAAVSTDLNAQLERIENMKRLIEGGGNGSPHLAGRPLMAVDATKAEVRASHQTNSGAERMMERAAEQIPLRAGGASADDGADWRIEEANF